MAKKTGDDETDNRRGWFPPRTTQDEQLLESPRADEFTHTDPWRVFRIMGEFVEGFDTLAHLGAAVTIAVGSRSPAATIAFPGRRAATIARIGGR